MDTRDMTDTRLLTENEIDNAIYAVLCAAFCAEHEEELRRVVRLRLPDTPTPLQIVDAVCAELRWRGLLEFEEQRFLDSQTPVSAISLKDQVREATRRIEKRAIVEALAETANNVTQAARKLVAREVAA